MAVGESAQDQVSFQEELEGIGIWLMDLPNADMQLLAQSMNKHPEATNYVRHVIDHLGAEEDQALEVEDFQTWLFQEKNPVERNGNLEECQGFWDVNSWSLIK